MKKFANPFSVVAVWFLLIGWWSSFAHGQDRPSVMKADDVRQALTFSGQSDKWDIDSGRFRLGTGTEIGSCRPFAFSADSQMFVYANGATMLAVDAAWGNVIHWTYNIPGYEGDGPTVVATLTFANYDQSLFVSTFWAGKMECELYRFRFRDDKRVLGDPFMIDSGKQKAAHFLGAPAGHDWLLAETTGHPFKVLDTDLSETRLEVKKYHLDGDHVGLGRFPYQHAAISSEEDYIALIGVADGEVDERTKRLSPNGKQVLRLWSTNTAKDFEEIFIKRNDEDFLNVECSAIAFSPNERVLAIGASQRIPPQPDPFKKTDSGKKPIFGEGAGTDLHELILIDIDSKKVKASKSTEKDPFALARPAGKVLFLTFDHTGRRLIVVDESKDSQYGIRMFGGENLRMGGTRKIRGLVDVAVSPGSDVMATVDENGVVQILRLNDLTTLAKFEQDRCGLLLFSPNGSKIACYSEDGRISIYDIQTLIDLSTRAKGRNSN